MLGDDSPDIHGTNGFTWFPSHGRHTLQCWSQVFTPTILVAFRIEPPTTWLPGLLPFTHGSLQYLWFYLLALAHSTVKSIRSSVYKTMCHYQAIAADSGTERPMIMLLWSHKYRKSFFKKSEHVEESVYNDSLENNYYSKCDRRFKATPHWDRYTMFVY